jgi:hypothetical protein
MKRFLFCLLAIALFWSCHPRSEGPKRLIEDGIEVVDNGTGVFPSPEGPRSLSLKEEFRIDLEDEALAAIGLTDIATIDADSKGRVYLFRRGTSQGPVVFQFDERGRFLKSFCAIGQGPGEVEYPHYLRLSPSDEIPIFSQGAMAINYYDTEGRFLRKKPVPSSLRFLYHSFKPLANGNFLVQYIPLDAEMRFSTVILGLFDGDFRKLKDIREHDIPESPEAIKNPLSRMTLVGVSGTAFFVNWGESGNDIAVFDLDGRLVRLIQSSFPSVPVPPEYKKDLLNRIPQVRSFKFIREFLERRDVFPAFQGFITDERNRLFVVGFEKDKESGANICDVFTPDGIRILKEGIGYQDLVRWIWDMQSFDVVLKNERCYCVREKPSGFKEVVVYSMIWR